MPLDSTLYRGRCPHGGFWALLDPPANQPDTVDVVCPECGPVALYPDDRLHLNHH